MSAQDSAYFIQIIQGDDKNLKLHITDNTGKLCGTDFIDTIYLTCKELNYTNQFTFNAVKQAWTILIPSSATMSFAPGKYKYDITIVFASGQTRTEVYQAPLCILQKTNVIKEE